MIGPIIYSHWTDEEAEAQRGGNFPRLHNMKEARLRFKLKLSWSRAQVCIALFNDHKVYNPGFGT